MPFASFIPLIAGALGAGATSLASSQNRKNAKDQNALLDEENREDRAHQITMMKLQADLQDDDQEAEERKIILLGASIGGLVLLILIGMIVKALLK